MKILNQNFEKVSDDALVKGKIRSPSFSTFMNTCCIIFQWIKNGTLTTLTLTHNNICSMVAQPALSLLCAVTVILSFIVLIFLASKSPEQDAKT